jgi:hypothetical protein
MQCLNIIASLYTFAYLINFSGRPVALIDEAVFVYFYSCRLV